MGSEMCIRDRDGCEVCIEWLTTKIRKCRDCVVGSGTAVGDRKDACLLYTSDAADERSSVDLGGRRIIKKKTRRAIV